MLFVDNEVDFFIVDGFFEFGDDFFREFSDDVRGNVREKVFNGPIGRMRGSLIEVREEFMNVFSGFFALVDNVRSIVVLDRSDKRRFSSLFVG